jgi:hypothetical protein
VFDLPFLLQIWAEKFSELLPRAVLVAGDIFNSKLIPAPPADSKNTAYVLYDILHNVGHTNACLSPPANVDSTRCKQPEHFMAVSGCLCVCLH